MVGDLYPGFYPLPPAPPLIHRGPSGDLPEASARTSDPRPPPSPALRDDPLADALLLCEETFLSRGETEVEDVLLWAEREKAGARAAAPGEPSSELGLLWCWERRSALPAAWQVQSEEPGGPRDLLVPDSDDPVVEEEEEVSEEGAAGGRAPTTWRSGPARRWSPGLARRLPCSSHDEAAAGAREVPRAAEEPPPPSPPPPPPSPGDSRVVGVVSGGEDEKARRAAAAASPPRSSGYLCHHSDSEDQVVITDYWFPEE